MTTATLPRTSAKSSASTTKPAPIRYVVIEGEPSDWPEEKKPRSPGVLPPDLDFVNEQTIGEFATIDQAIEVCRKINEVQTMTGMYDKSWAIVVVKF
jgi:hypothetical protein